jgi:hypothetical protein
VAQQNPNTVKLAPILAEYLYTNKKLDVPGIGTLQIEDADIPDTEDRKQSQPISISFRNDTSIKEDPDLISYIANKTGKMKALAASDLGSHLELAHQLLNIGKPFVMEGIGSLTKLRSGQYEFSQSEITTDKLKDRTTKDSKGTSEESFTDFTKRSSAVTFKAGKLVPLLLIIAGIVIAIVVGYKMYEKRVSKNTDTTATVPESSKEETVPVKMDSSAFIKTADTTKSSDTVITREPVLKKGTYKFVVEEANNERALLRYNSLKSWGLPVQMETTDSVNFKIYFMLPSSITDTAKTMDSLRILYTPVWSKSYVEH